MANNSQIKISEMRTREKVMFISVEATNSRKEIEIKVQNQCLHRQDTSNIYNLGYIYRCNSDELDRSIIVIISYLNITEIICEIDGFGKPVYDRVLDIIYKSGKHIPVSPIKYANMMNFVPPLAEVDRYN